MKKDERHTLADTFEPLERAHGPFTLDAAATRENRKCRKYFDKAMNGLRQSWAGESVWCNPPYSKCPAFVEKAFDEVFLRQRCPKVVMLIPANRTEQPFWQDLVEPYRDGKDPDFGLRTENLYRRRTFGTPENAKGKSGNKFGSVVLIFENSASAHIKEKTTMELKLAILAGAESKAWLANLTKQLDRLEALASKLPVDDVEEEAADDADDDEEFVSTKALKTAAKKTAKSFDDDDDAEEDAEEEEAEEDAEEEEEVKPKKNAKKLTVDDVNDACKARAAAGGKKGRAEVLSILKKKFKTESVSELEPEQFAACIKAMRVEQ